jgi:hypoxia up-regulated 1
LLANLTANGDLNGTDFNLTNILTHDGNLTNGNVAGANNETAPVAPKQKLRKRILRVPLKIIEVTEGPAKPLSSKGLTEAIQRLEKLNAADAKKRATEAAKNNLESYIYSAKDQLETLLESDKELSQADRDSFMEKLAEAEDWLYMDGEDAGASEFQDRLEALKSTWKSLFVREEPAKESSEKDELLTNLAEEVTKKAEQASRPETDIPSTSHDEL